MGREPPAPPADLPAYATDPLKRQDVETLDAIQDYIDDLIAHKRAEQQRAVDEDALADEDEQLVDVDERDGDGTVVIKKVPCGKDCDGCPHGPYKYTVRREGGSLSWEYHGPATE